MLEKTGLTAVEGLEKVVQLWKKRERIDLAQKDSCGLFCKNSNVNVQWEFSRITRSPRLSLDVFTKLKKYSSKRVLRPG